MTGGVEIRAAVPGDGEEIARFIAALARFEGLVEQLDLDPARIDEQLSSPNPPFSSLLAERNRTAVGFALFFPTYSTFRAKPCLWLEDLFVMPEHRGAGIGLALLRAVAAEAVARGCPRLDWCVLDWNTEAIAFYRRHGARVMPDWRVCRLEGDALRSLGA